MDRVDWQAQILIGRASIVQNVRNCERADGRERSGFGPSDDATAARRLQAVPEGHLPSNRRLVQRFAAHLAHVLNDGNEVVTVQAFALFTRLTATLERREKGSDSGPYDGLTGLRVLGPGTTPQEAALAYFDHVLKRPLQLARDEPLHKGHAVFLALCRRGRDPAWPQADLKRTVAKPAAGTANPPAEFVSVADRLARLSPGISDGNPAKSTRASLGPLFLHAGGAATEVAEEMSLWDATTCAPARLNVLARGPQFNGFCSAMIKVLEAANARYGTLIALGLSPRDWQDLSVNTAKKVSAFLSAARAKGAELPKRVPGAALSSQSPGDDNLADWELAWTQRPVPGFKSAREFWDSPLGYALRYSQVPIMVDFEDAQIEDPHQQEPNVLDSISFDSMLERAQRGGVLSPYDAWLLRKLSQGETLAELAAARETRRALEKDNVSKGMVETYVSGLGARIHAFVNGLPAS
jgi:hypothetical protein